jgi:hypothetical protein
MNLAMCAILTSFLIGTFFKEFLTGIKKTRVLCPSSVRKSAGLHSADDRFGHAETNSPCACLVRSTSVTGIISHAQVVPSGAAKRRSSAKSSKTHDGVEPRGSAIGFCRRCGRIVGEEARYARDLRRLCEVPTALVIISPSLLPKAAISIGAGSKLFTSERTDSA